ncbi:RNA-directed DNA polymerase, eukaryota [Tanacetum coccineum]
MLWDYLSLVISNWEGEVVIMRDFNEVVTNVRFGSVFNRKGADNFNSFIFNAGLVEAPLDHRLILMREVKYDYGSVPFRFFHYWLEIDGFDKLVEDTWKEAQIIDSNAFLKMLKKLRYLKDKIRLWSRLNKESSNSRKRRLKAELADLDLAINKGDGEVIDVNRIHEVVRLLQDVEKIESLEVAQKAKIKWAIEGDENSKYYHDVLNKKRGQLAIRGVLVDGIWMESPPLVKNEFLTHFKNRFDQPVQNRIQLEMNFLNRINSDQKDDLEREIDKEEVKRAVWDCGIDKAPGLDGFTFGFYRRYWNLIASDVVDAISCFFQQGVIPKGGNSSFITLIPKVPNANMVKDFRPISLIGSLYKIIAKILANRLVTVLGTLVNETQSAFVADRQILDRPFILNELVKWCKKNKKQAMIFKVDFEKAYDSGSVIVNGSPTKEFQFYKGLKQGLFKGIVLSPSLNISHLFYANDAIFMGQWSQINIDTITHVLECFHHASGLRINMIKSKLMGISVDISKVEQAVAKIGCVTLKTPFNYLGLKVGGLMSRLQSWNEIVESIATRLSRWKLKTLSIGGILTLLKSVLGAIPIYHMSIFKVPMKVLQRMESIVKSRVGLDGKM